MSGHGVMCELCDVYEESAGAGALVQCMCGMAHGTSFWEGSWGEGRVGGEPELCIQAAIALAWSLGVHVQSPVVCMLNGVQGL